MNSFRVQTRSREGTAVELGSHRDLPDFSSSTGSSFSDTVHVCGFAPHSSWNSNWRSKQVASHCCSGGGWRSLRSLRVGACRRAAIHVFPSARLPPMAAGPAPNKSYGFCGRDYHVYRGEGYCVCCLNYKGRKEVEAARLTSCKASATASGASPPPSPKIFTVRMSSCCCTFTTVQYSPPGRKFTTRNWSTAGPWGKRRGKWRKGADARSGLCVAVSPVHGWRCRRDPHVKSLFSFASFLSIADVCCLRLSIWCPRFISRDLYPGVWESPLIKSLLIKSTARSVTQS